MRRKKTAEKALPYDEWEQQLFQTLSPVDPDPVFIDRLRQRLERPEDVVLESRMNRRALAAALLAAATFLMILFAWFLRDTSD